MYGLTRGGLEVVSGGCGLRQAGGRGSVVGKDIPYARTGWGSDGFAPGGRGKSLMVEFDIPALVRTRYE